MSSISLLPSVNKTIHPSDSLAPVYRAQYGIDEYFRSGLVHVDVLDQLARTHLGVPFSGLGAIADFACHYGRLLRAFRVAAPKAKLVACDIDNGALDFCAQEFGAEKFHSAWTPASTVQPPVVDLLICVSLLTHTRYAFMQDILQLWEQMVRPGGLLLFTFLGAGYMRSWEAGEMAHYGPATPDDIARVSREFKQQGHAVHSYLTGYSDSEYGVGFVGQELVTKAIEARKAFEIIEFRPGTISGFGQDLAIVRRR